MAVPSSPLRLRAEAAEDIEVLSALLEGAVVAVSEISWRKSRRDLMLPLLRRADSGSGSVAGGAMPVAAALLFDGVLRVRSCGIPDPAGERTLRILQVRFLPGAGCDGEIRICCADGAEIAVEVECIEAHLADLPVKGGG